MATVLIVDDDCNMRILTSARLEGLYSVVCACDGEEALQIIRSGGIDLVIADIMMPKMDGFELLTAIRNEGNNIPFLLFLWISSFLHRFNRIYQLEMVKYE